MAPHDLPSHGQAPHSGIPGPSLWDSNCSSFMSYHEHNCTWLPQRSASGVGSVFCPRVESNFIHWQLELKVCMPRILFGLSEITTPPALCCQNNLTLRDSLFCLISPYFKSCPWWCSPRAFKPSWATGFLPLETCPAPVLTPWHPSISGYWSLLSDFLLATVLFLRLGPILTSVFMRLCPICHSVILYALLGFSCHWPASCLRVGGHSSHYTICCSQTSLVIQPGGCLEFPSSREGFEGWEDTICLRSALNAISYVKLSLSDSLGQN